ncbi:MAG: nuclear transport factor 2 family protein [Actinobacteria bacterium]|nr:nuclear transport factor 2 family protein [Actinomycetota bacterium]
MTDYTPEEKELFDLRASFVDYLNAGDADGIVATFADDVVLVPPNSEVVVGRDAAREMFAAMAGGPVRMEHGPVSRLTIEGSLAYTVGCYYLHIGEGEDAQTVFGRSIEVWRRGEDGQWLTVADMWRDEPAVPDSGPEL